MNMWEDVDQNVVWHLPANLESSDQDSHPQWWVLAKVEGTKHGLLTTCNPADWSEVSVSMAETD